MEDVTHLAPGQYSVKGELWNLPEHYEIKARVGSGAYGCVCKAADRGTGRLLAVKRIANVFISKTDALRILREISILRRLNHPNVISLVDVPKIPPLPAPVKTMYVVFEFAGVDMHKLVHQGTTLPVDTVRVLMKQMCMGVRYLHHSCVIHRDLKPANILIDTTSWRLKIADFGLSRVLELGTDSKVCPHLMSSNDESSERDVDDGDQQSNVPPKMSRQISEHVVTRWYRAPEVILCRGHYGYSIDVWSVGCIFAELLNMADRQPKAKKRPLFPGRSCFPLSPSSQTCFKDVTDQLNVIFSIIGTPSQAEIDSLEAGEDVKTYLTRLPASPPVDLYTRFPEASDEEIKILKGMIEFLAEKRMTLDEALDLPYLAGVDAPADADGEQGRVPMLQRKSSTVAAEDLLALDLEHQYDRRNHEEAVVRLSAMFRREIDSIHTSESRVKRGAPGASPPPPAGGREQSEEFYDCHSPSHVQGSQVV